MADARDDLRSTSDSIQDDAVRLKDLEQEKMRRLVDQLLDRDSMPTAWHELASKGAEAVPVLLEALERRELEVRHLAFRLLESVTGESLTFQSDAPDEVRLRQVALLRARLEKP